MYPHRSGNLHTVLAYIGRTQVELRAKIQEGGVLVIVEI